jgi:hypothetical protein
MLTFWQAMEKREAELAEREREVAEGVREWVEATQDFNVDDVIITAQEQLGLRKGDLTRP